MHDHSRRRATSSDTQKSAYSSLSDGTRAHWGTYRLSCFLCAYHTTTARQCFCNQRTALIYQSRLSPPTNYESWLMLAFGYTGAWRANCLHSEPWWGAGATYWRSLRSRIAFRMSLIWWSGERLVCVSFSRKLFCLLVAFRCFALRSEVPGRSILKVRSRYILLGRLLCKLSHQAWLG